MQRGYEFRFWGAFLLIALCGEVLSASGGQFGTGRTSGQLEPSASFVGKFYYERVGYYMENAGDVNNDGFEDFLIGTFHNRENGYDAGAAYLILGDSLNVWGFKKRLSESDARFLGKYEYDAFGYYVSGNGDVNGDGIDDFVIGAPAGNETGGPNPGYAFLFFGRTAADWGNECVAMDQADASFIGRHEYDHAGEAVAIVGDVNQDGYDDFIISAPLNDDGAEESGKAYLFLGKADGWERNTDIETADASFSGDKDRQWAGYVVSSAGDINGDGFADFLIGAPHHDYFGGRIFLMFGRANVDWGANFNLNYADVIFQGEFPYDRAGWSLACAGDVNNDGFSDILIGAPDNDDSGNKAGKVYLVLGKATGWQKTMNLRDADASWQGERVDNEAGWSVSGLPDTNYDGCDEILIGAWRNDHIGPNCGKAYLIYGRETNWQKEVNLIEIPDYFPGEYEGDYAGFCVAGNDVNGDGLGDAWVSASYNNDRKDRAGKVYLFLSQRDRYQINGQVKYYSNQNPVSNVSLFISGDTTDTLVSGENGNYDLFLPHHRSYTFRPIKTEQPDSILETIMAYDAALALQASVGLIKLDGLQQIAADADQDSSITAFDAALIARYVVELKDSSSHVGEWVFSPAEMSYPYLNKDHLNQDFSAVVIGDVHGGWYCPDSIGEPGNLYKTDLPVAIVADGQVKIPIQVAPGVTLFSLQLNLKFPYTQMSFSGIEGTGKNSNFQFITNQSQDEFKFALYSAQPIKSEKLFLTLVFDVRNELTGADRITIEKLQINNSPPLQGTLFFNGETRLEIPEKFSLYPNYPNPFNHSTAIRLEVDDNTKIKLAIYNLNGEIIKTIADRNFAPGNYIFYWDGSDEHNRFVSSGIYLCRGRSEQDTKSLKVMFLK